MHLFIDTSALVKLYHTEKGTERLWNILEENKNNLFISVSKVSITEVHSAFMKKVRTNEIKRDDAISALDFFKLDVDKFNVISLNDNLIDVSIDLILHYSEQKNLRSLDSLQLSSAIICNISNKIDKFISSDLDLLAVAENFFETINPEV